MSHVTFPQGFQWGAATASYQIEGAAREDGKGESIWDRFAHTPGRIEGGETGDHACDSYHRYRDDVALLRAMNLTSYRFSIAWPRVQPEGRGGANPAGLDYYRRLVDALLEAGIRPFPTLYHWDLPQALEARGGWPDRDTAARFADYAQLVVRALGDRVSDWMLFNEPAIFTLFGYGLGIHAPGRSDRGALLRATHTVALAQAEGFRAVKQERPGLRVGSAFSMQPTEPASDSASDADAAERMHGWINDWFLRPALRGAYPDCFEGGVPEELMDVREGDMLRVRAPLDFVGINLYSRMLVRADAKDGLGLGARSLGMGGDTGPKTDFGWEVWPDSLRTMLLRVTRDYERPVLEITENGCSYADAPGDDGVIRDQRRIDFFRGYLAALQRAISEGADVRGYHAWSLLDNFEWAAGFAQRFGLAWTDFATCERTLKQSGEWFGRVAAGNGLDPDAEGTET
jgi:beta-glucosidase